MSELTGIACAADHLHPCLKNPDTNRTCYPVLCVPSGFRDNKIYKLAGIVQRFRSEKNGKALLLCAHVTKLGVYV